MALFLTSQVSPMWWRTGAFLGMVDEIAHFILFLLARPCLYMFRCVCVYPPPARVIFPYHELVMFQPRTGNTPGLGSAAYCYVDKYPVLTHPPLLLLYFLPREVSNSCPLFSLVTNRWAPTQDHLPTWESPISFPSYQNLTCRYLSPAIPFSHPACLIPVATAPLPPPKSLLIWPSDGHLPPTVSATVPVKFSRLHIPSPPARKLQIWAGGHPLHQCVLSSVNVRCFGVCIWFLEWLVLLVEVKICIKCDHRLTKSPVRLPLLYIFLSHYPTFSLETLR